MRNEAYDFCIVGTGAGGGILAYRLAQAGFNVVSVEQGKELPPNYFTSLNPPGIRKWYGIRPKTTFPPTLADALFIHELFADSRTRSSTQKSEQQFRQFQIYALNGLQNLWNGVCVRFAPSDFTTWPLSYDDLEPHYSAVEQKIIVCGTKEKIPNLPDGHFIPPKPLRPADTLILDAMKKLHDPNSYAIPNRKAIETRLSKSNHCISTGICTYGCPVGAMYSFSKRLLPEIRSLKNYTLLLNAKVTRLECDKETHRIVALEYCSLETMTMHKIHAKTFILCAGAIETPRILFNSRNEVFQYGLANRSRTLGCYLQDNPKVVLATSLYKLWFKKKPNDIGYGDLLILLGKGETPSKKPFHFIGHSISAPPDVPYYLKDVQYIPRFLKKHLVKMMYNSFVTLGLFCEGDLLKSNRVVSSKKCDQYGVPQVDIHYRSSDETNEKMQTMAKFGKKLLKKASATLIEQDFSNDGTGIHYAGTTRLGHCAKEAIVDCNLKTFDHDNLYLCDGGVIPHLPDKHLTLTIMALADRLARHLIQISNREGNLS